MSMLRRILDDGLSSRLPYNVVERKGLAYSVGATLEGFHDAGAFEIDGASAPHKVAQTVREVLRTLRSLSKGQISSGELERARTRFRMSVESQQDSPGDLLGWFAGDELFHPPATFEERCRRVEEITKAQLVRLANTYLRADRVLSVAVGPRESRAPLRKALKASARR
jgi:predicted Zn-dependent peptidase